MTGGGGKDCITRSPLYRDYCDYITNGDPPTEGPFYTCPICHQQVQLCSKNNSYAPERYMIKAIYGYKNQYSVWLRQEKLFQIFSAMQRLSSFLICRGQEIVFK